MAAWPHGYEFFAHLRDLPGALRVDDLPAYARSLGYTAELTLSKTGQATPMRHRGVLVGHFFLGEKEGGQAFTAEDEEVLVLFASQAAAAIANARTHRDEQRARADLEALVDTSPVGVVVFDARSGRPLSFNREARRIVGACAARAARRSSSGGDDLPAHRRARGRARRVSAGATPEQRRDGARGGDRAVGPGRAQHRHAGQRHADPFGGRRGRDGGGDHAGPGAARGAGPAARRVPRHGEPRAARAADHDQGLRRHAAGDLPGPGPGGDARVPPHHRRAGRSHARPDRRPARRRAHRRGHALGVPEASEVAALVDRARNTFSPAAPGTACRSTCRRTCRG